MKKNIENIEIGKGDCDCCGEYSEELHQIEKTSMWACSPACELLLRQEMMR